MLLQWLLNSQFDYFGRFSTELFFDYAAKQAYELEPWFSRF